MDELDIVYKAFREYRNQIKNEARIIDFKKDLKGKASVLEKLESVTTTCIIEKSWVDEIDACLPYVIKAVKEERQFVKTEGETLPIDRIRSVSKDSVEDLAKHSNYITRKQEDKDKIVPDKLLMSKKESDYAIYENRFLYTLLDYMYQFIEIRFNEILALTGKYEARTEIIKKQSNAKRIVDFNLTFYEKRFNDSIARSANNSQDAIDRIQSYLTQTRALLATPLMKEVSEKPKVGFPIVKTNVLKFNTNFKHALRLFEFLHSYNGKGYEIKTSKINMSPFAPTLSDEFGEVIYLSSFITYVLINGYDKKLAKTYEENEKKKKKEEDEKFLKELKRIEKDIKASNLTPEEYIQKLKKAKAILEKEVEQKEIELENIHNDINILKNEIVEEVIKGKEEQKAEDNLILEETKEKHENERIELKSQIKQLEKEKEDVIIESNNKIEEARIQASNDIQNAKDEANKLVQDTNNEMNKQIEENRSLKAEINSLRELNHMEPITDFTSREDFDELELEKNAFDKFFNRTWKDTKKVIRKNLLGKKK